MCDFFFTWELTRYLLFFRPEDQFHCQKLSFTTTLKLSIHLATVWPNKSERVANACRAFATAVRAFPLTSTCDKDMPIVHRFVHHSSGISFGVRSFLPPTREILANGEQTWPNVFIHVCCEVHSWWMHTFVCVWPNTFGKCIRGLTG